jgi:hypothetical protein
MDEGDVTTEALKALADIVLEARTNLEMAVQMRGEAEGIALQSAPTPTLA